METEITTQPVESVPAETGSQGSEQTTQVAEQNQDTGTVKVDNSQQPTSSDNVGRKPSDYYRERNKMRQMSESIKALTDKLNQLESKKSDTPTYSVPNPKDDEEEANRFYANPRQWYLDKMKAEREAIRQEILNDVREKEIPAHFENLNRKKEYDMKSQDALELIFPKTSPDSKDTWEERATKDMARTEAIYKIMSEYGLDKLSEVDPVKAARTTMELYESKKLATNKKNPLAPTKAQMASTSSSMPNGGGKKMPTSEELKAQQESLFKKMDANPNLMEDPEFAKQWKLVKEELSKTKGN